MVNLNIEYLSFLLMCSGMVKKSTGNNTLGVIVDRSSIVDNSVEECRSAISHTKESRASISMGNMLNPDRVLSLFKKMLDVVKFVSIGDVLAFISIGYILEFFCAL